jgi:hypothetical protein
MAERKRNWRWWFRVIHRDVGYFLFGMTIIYGVSGIALNHINDFDPSYAKTINNIRIDTSGYDLSSDDDIMKIVDFLDESKNYKNHRKRSGGRIKVYLERGSIDIEPSGEIVHERFRRRPILYEANLLHYNPGVWWKWFSDLFAVGMILLATTGIFLVKGKNSLTRSGKIYFILGIIIPLLFLYFYYT